MDNSFFPISLTMHIILALLALLVFGMQFIRFRKSHHLVLAIALPCTLLPYLSDNQTFFYTVGVFEGVALILAGILSQTLDRDKSEAAAKETADTGDTEDEE
ncbi:MAG: hypothetical protein II916_01860 [Oscillospiraceae bacterium]|nr:hypothetical protein [Oscillospiraceae bacterium]